MFSETINLLGNHANLSANECENFGMTWGCKGDCPVFERGDCKDSYYVNLEKFIKDKDFCKESAIEQIEVYKSKLTKEEYNELIGLTDVLE